MDTMNFEYCPDFQALSQAASDHLLKTISLNPQAVICLATGGTPQLTYPLFVDAVKKNNLDIRGVTFVKLDEWLGIPLENVGTCESFLRKHIVDPLGIDAEHFISFRSQHVTADECSRVATLITQKGGIDLCLLGLGKNGHLGLNEPGECLMPSCHITVLDEKTRHHDMLKNAAVPVEQGITLGLTDILSAKEVLLLVAGEGKQKAFAELQQRSVSCALPASFLWLHPRVRCLFDGSEFQRVSAQALAFTD
ncbi:galactosamine-6-phosphate isomerase [Enterobacter sp. ENT03]|uniref:galactosamine-6-phosphate isomerase n=1 Tax=Enterobacter sp. ENT03 TaxID=2854780 RepID=UPI001C45DD22|nr:galactosamine-6-phosphate isomerase [Enterobacter sp. ENT03]MBV7404975.1 galactosamine-6-phosphate isomerase [Enterobacter sp. ENT03]